MKCILHEFTRHKWINGNKIIIFVREFKIPTNKSVVMEDKLDCDKENSINSVHKEQLLKYLAWQIKPFSLYYDTYHICRTLNIPKQEIESCLKELENDNIIFLLPKEYGKDTLYILKAEVQLQLLIDIKKSREKPSYVVPPNLYPSTRWKKEEWRIIIQNYLLEKNINDTMPSYVDYEPIRYLLMTMPTIPEWMPFFKKLSTEIVDVLFHEYKDVWDTALLRPNLSCLNNGYFENEALSAERRERYKTEFGFYQYVLSGRINEIPGNIPADIPDGMYLHAIYHQYKGDISETIELYEKALKGMNAKYFKNALLNFFYAIALLNDSTVESKKKLENLFFKEYLPCELLAAQLLVLYTLNEKPDHALNYLKYDTEGLPRLTRVLVSLVIRHFHLDTKIKIKDKDIQEIIEDKNLKLLQLECSQDFVPFTTKAECLQRETGLFPLLPPHQKVNEWERVITLLLEKARELPQKKKNKNITESQGRITYRIDAYNRVIPYLQKSKDGIVWSKGRVISLATFQQGMPEMNDTDHALKAFVKHISDSWSENERWLLSGPKPILQLAGHPLVFSNEQPEKPIIIRKEVPEIIVTKVKDGFKMEGNVDPDKIEGTYMLKRENDFLIRIIELSAFQRDVMLAINRVPLFPIQAEKRLTELLQELSKSITVHSDLIENHEDFLQPQEDTFITFRLQPLEEGFKAELFIKPFKNQSTYCKVGEGPLSIVGNIDGKRVQVIRDFKKEKAHREQVLEWLQPISEDYVESEDVFYFKDIDKCLLLLNTLQEHTETIHIDWPEGVKLTIKGKADFNNLKLTVKGIKQWFEVTGELKVNADTMINLADLLLKVRESKGHFISISKTEFISISEKLRKQLLATDALLTHKKEKLLLPAIAAEYLLEMEQQGVKLKKDTKFKSLIQRIEASEAEQYPLPKNLQADLRKYQIDGFQWMSRLARWGAGACLADDMGVGKTLQAIALMLAHASEGPSLVVAPASVILNWKHELGRFAPSLTPLLIHENGCDRKILIKQASPMDVMLVTYGLLSNEIESLADKEWNIIALDEAHNIKNKDTKVFKATMQLKGNFRLLLTGTPIQNHLGEIWSLFQFANPGLLGSFTQFNDKFIRPIEKSGDKEKQRLLKKLLSPFILRRTKTEVLDELPEKTEITLYIELNDKERALYENIRLKVLHNLEKGSTTVIQALTEITGLRQAACHPALIDPNLNIPSSKSDSFIKLTKDLIKNNHRALAFSQFTSHLALIRKELEEEGIDYLYLDGSMTAEERNTQVKKFRTGDQPLFLISLKAGGTGLNLTAADFVIHLDPWWNPAVEDQASDRVYRIGQTRPVTVYHLIARQTIEEKIIQLHQSKKSLANSLLDENDLSHKLTKKEILELLKRVN